MKERPILFSGPMVRALRDGSKTQTRRIVKPQPAAELNWAGWCITSTHTADEGKATWARGEGPHLVDAHRVRCPYGQPGDRLAVRETFYAWGHWTKRYSEKKHREEWHFVDETTGTGKAYRYEADEKLPRRKRELHEVGWWKRPAIFMPRAASRITLEITRVRVERLQDISEADAKAEGVALKNSPAAFLTSYVRGFRDLWESINGPGSWAANPWVWRVEFRRLP